MITINGNKYSGSNVVVLNNKVIIDGKDVTPDSKNIEIKIDGDINELKVDNCNNIEVNGNVNNIKTQNGDVEINGNINGSITSMNGDIDCHNIGGSVSTVNGNVKHRSF